MKKKKFFLLFFPSLTSILSLLIMPVKSPNINTKDQSIAMPTEALIKEPTAVILAEETNENVNKEKLNQMKFMMKTFVLGALREKEQVNKPCTAHYYYFLYTIDTLLEELAVILYKEKWKHHCIILLK
ncbi:hypothetical protein BDB01DRAFT_211855 [Pilobolus umbonatus]|nr:hypothetical protein BDB01DRAFT_211855 [Pilobolus umbonatus]